MALTRRTVLTSAAAAGAATVVLPRAAEAAVSPTAWIVPMLARATYAASPSEIALARRYPTQAAWLEAQLNPATIPDPTGDAVRALYPELAWNIPTARAKLDQFSWDGMFALGQATLGLAAWSRRQVYERMVEFWSNHLNVTNPSDSVWASRMSYDRAVIRPFALGRFSDMLAASATHPAMLTYLNQADSTKDQPNENYGRELLELHTVGIGHYTEDMVKDSARIMTGWTVDDNGLPRYDPSNHATGPVRVMGFTHPNASPDGRPVVAAYLKYLALHPYTAQRIARKLATHFVSDDPPQALIDALVKTYRASGSDIRPVLRRLFATTEWTTGVKLKTPYEDIVSSVRMLGIGLLPATRAAADRREGVQALYWRSGDLRHAPLAWGPPNGYPDVAVGWQAADIALGRWNTHQALAAAWWPNRDMLSIPQSRALLPAALPTTYGALVDRLSERLLNRRLDPTSKTAVLVFLHGSNNKPLPAGDEWLGWRLPYLVALLLDTPTFARR